MDLETMTNMILQNDYDLHEKEKIDSAKTSQTNSASTKVRGYGLDEYYQEESQPVKEQKIQTTKTKTKKKKKTKKKRIFFLLKLVGILVILFVAFVFLFFKTSLFQKWKELWVQTAMTTMSHQYLATWFLSQEEIDQIMKKLEVQNNENSDSSGVLIQNKGNGVAVEKIIGSGYVGYVLTVENATKVKLVDGRKAGRGSKLSEIVKANQAIAGTNAGGFADPNGVGSGNVLCDAVIMDRKLLYGNKNTRYSLIGLSKDHKLVLGKYNYQEALNAGIESAVEFGPFIIVNGKDQIKNANSGGIQPRMAIGQKQDGTFIFVAIDGRQPGYSIGTNLLELQKIFKKYGAYNAANLDGGSSATMYYDGKVVNKTSTPMGERYLPNAFIVTK